MFNFLILLGLASAEITVKSSIPSGNEVLDGYVSFSIEFSSFPDYAGVLETIRCVAGLSNF